MIYLLKMMIYILKNDDLPIKNDDLPMGVFHICHDYPHLGSCEVHRPRHGPKPAKVTVHGAPTAVPSTATMG